MENAKQLIDQIQSGELSADELMDLSMKITAHIQDFPFKGRELGPLMSLISQAMKKKTETADINWVAVGNGALAIGHKPGGKVSCAGMKNAGATGVLTLLQGHEGALQIGDKVKKAGMEWIWFPFSAALEDLTGDTNKMTDLFAQLKTKIDLGGKIYVHCSAGIHRTGMITYGFLRYMEFSMDEAKLLLRQMREVTAEQVGEERLQWGEQFAGVNSQS